MTVLRVMVTRVKYYMRWCVTSTRIFFSVKYAANIYEQNCVLFILTITNVKDAKFVLHICIYYFF